MGLLDTYLGKEARDELRSGSGERTEEVAVGMLVAVALPNSENAVTLSLLQITRMSGHSQLVAELKADCPMPYKWRSTPAISGALLSGYSCLASHLSRGVISLTN
jgi:hypothetical protein